MFHLVFHPGDEVGSLSRARDWWQGDSGRPVPRHRRPVHGAPTSSHCSAGTSEGTASSNMLIPLEIAEYAASRREVLLREAVADRLARRVTLPGRSRWHDLAVALRAVARHLKSDMQPADEWPTAVTR